MNVHPRRRFPRVCATLLALALSAAVTSPAFAAGPAADRPARLDLALRHWKDHGGRARERVIVRFQPGARGAVLGCLRAAALDVRLEHPSVRAFTVEVSRAALDRLARNPNVESISLDAPVAAQTTVAPSGPTLMATLGLPSYTASRGGGVGIAIVDSGIRRSTVFGSRITAFYDFTSGTPSATTPVDPYGHGTHVAGLAAGSGAPSGGRYLGVAPGANLIGLRVLDGQGQGYTSNVIAAVEFATANRAALGVDVINLSLGHPILEPAASDPLVQAVEAAVRAGIVVVVSAGNIGTNAATGEVGYAGITSPGNAPSAVTVGAVDTNGTRTRRDDAVTPYSSRGPTWYDGAAKPDLVAPGHALTAVSGVYCKLYQDHPGAHASVWWDDNKYLRLSGTSMAAAVVSGVAASMIQAHRNTPWWSSPDLPPNVVKAVLQYSAVRMLDPSTGLPYDRLTQGAGEVNAAGAIELARAIDASVPVGSRWTVWEPVPATTIAGQDLAWSQHIVWGSHIVWGESLFYHEAAWDPPTPWGDLDSTHIVWGELGADHIVWGELAVWSDHIVWGDSLVGTVDGEHIVWGDVVDAEHIVWGELNLDHIVWGDTVTGYNEAGAADEVFIDDTNHEW